MAPPGQVWRLLPPLNQPNDYFMSKTLILEITDGNFEDGFSVVLRVDGEQPQKITGSLPPSPEMPDLYKNWQISYSEETFRSRIKVKESQVTNFSISGTSKKLEKELNNLFDSGERQFQPIRDELIKHLDDEETLQLIVDTDCELLWKLPWHLWDTIAKSQVEVSFSSPQYKQSQRWQNQSSDSQVNVLAILGDSEGIDIAADEKMLAEVPGARVNFLVEPQRQEINDRLWEKSWDILFFAGHSSSRWEEGRIFINSTDSLKTNSLTIEQLKYGLKKAIANGLKLAIFNSCDGLKLAKSLADLNLPCAIVMREPVPDRVAQEFLRYFLEAFSGGKRFPVAVREAREKLQGIEDEFPCASWLPVICQNPTEPSPTWSELGDRSTTPSSPSPPSPPLPTRPWQGLKTILLSSLVVSSAVMGIRFFGGLEPLELRAFDELMRSRPREGPDPRMLVVTIDNKDVEYQRSQGMSLEKSISDEALTLLLDKLKPLNPSSIGLSIYHDHPLSPALSDRLKQQDYPFFFLCKTREENTDPEGLPPPKDISQEFWGFNDVVPDPGKTLRRAILIMSLSDATDPCSKGKFDYSFSFMLTRDYLESRGFQTQYPKGKKIQIGDLVIPTLKARSSGYQGLDDRGYQILLNYRADSSPKDIARKIPLRDILESDEIVDKLQELLDENPIILIGNIQTSGKYWPTPYGQKIPGVLLQAQMASQIISAVLDGRPLIWWWPWWVDALWISGWSLAGGIVAWYVRDSRGRIVGVAVSLGVIFGICFFIFTDRSGWVPLVPPGLACVGTMLEVARRQTRSLTQNL